MTDWLLDPEFKLIWEGNGPRGGSPTVNEDGLEAYDVYQIWNKVHKDRRGGKLYYVITCWQGDGDFILVEEEIANAQFPIRVEQWEREHGRQWEALHDMEPQLFHPEIHNTPSPGQSVRSIHSSQEEPTLDCVSLGDRDEEEMVVHSQVSGNPAADDGQPSASGTRRPPITSPGHSQSSADIIPETRLISPIVIDSSEASVDGSEGSRVPKRRCTTMRDSASPHNIRTRSNISPDTVALPFLTKANDDSSMLQAALAETQAEEGAEEEAEEEAEAKAYDGEGNLDESQDPAKSEGRNQSFQKYSDQLIEAHQDCIRSLLTTALDLEGMPCQGWVDKRKSSKTSNYRKLLEDLWMMLLGYDSDILQALVAGNLPKKYVDDRNFRRKLQGLANLTDKEYRPSIYAQYLVDSYGNSPTTSQVMKILEYIEIYVEGLNDSTNKSSSNVALEVDAMMGGTVGCSSNNTGKRRYIEGPRHAAKCKVWIANVRMRLTDLPTEEPLKRPLCEVGYATFPKNRLDQHKNHTSSNYLMNLTESVCKLYFPEYSIAQFVVFRLASNSHAMYAEILTTRFALAYASKGGGFCHYQAGVSRGEVEKAPEDYWPQEAERLVKSGLSDRMNAELERIQAKTRIYEEALRLPEVYKQRIERVEKLTADCKVLGSFLKLVLMSKDKKQTDQI